MRAWNGVKHARPEIEQFQIDFGGIAEGTEAQRLPRRGRLDRRGIGRRRKTPRGCGHADQLFAVKFIGYPRRISEGIGDAVVDRGKAGGCGVTEITDLQGSGFAGEKREAVAGGVAGEIDEDVDFLGADQLGDRRIGETDDGVPGFRAGAEESVRESGCATSLKQENLKCCGSW